MSLKKKDNAFATMIFCFLIAASHSVYAGGIALGSTRIIYPIGDKQVSLPIINSDDKNVYLIQSWVDDFKGNKTTSFVVTPPLFVINPKRENILRIMYAGDDLPLDRESVFYFNSKAIPSVDKSKVTGNSLQIATQSVIKLFMRPKNLPTRSLDAPESLRCNLGVGTINIHNPSPYYVTLVQLRIGGKLLPNTMISPKSSKDVAIPSGDSGEITFQTVNDYGANTPKQICKN